MPMSSNIPSEFLTPFLSIHQFPSIEIPIPIGLSAFSHFQINLSICPFPILCHVIFLPSLVVLPFLSPFSFCPVSLLCSPGPRLVQMGEWDCCCCWGCLVGDWGLGLVADGLNGRMEMNPSQFPAHFPFQSSLLLPSFSTLLCCCYCKANPNQIVN